MNENWAQLILTGLVGYIIWELRQLRSGLSGVIYYTECNRRMQEMDENIRQNNSVLLEHEKRISTIEGKQNEKSF